MSSRHRPGRGRRRGVLALRILFEDDALVVIDKPAGLLTVPLDRRESAPSIYSLLETYLRPRGKRRPLVVHRIDRDTSGLVVFAKRVDAQQRLRQQFRRREPERVYVAVVYGHPEPQSGAWRGHLAWDRRTLMQKGTRATDPAAKEAVSHYRVLERYADTSLVEVRLETGRQNQIRIQARLAGHPLVGERRYVSGGIDPGAASFRRQVLHAQSLTFLHPVSNRRITFAAPLPPDLDDLLVRLRGGCTMR